MKQGDFLIELREFGPGSAYLTAASKHYEFFWVYDGAAQYGLTQTPGSLGPNVVRLRPPRRREMFHWSDKCVSRAVAVRFPLLAVAAAAGPLPPAEQWPLERKLSSSTGDLLRPLFKFLLALRDPLTNKPTDLEAATRATALLLRLFVTDCPAPLEPPRPQIPPCVLRTLSLFRRQLAAAPHRTPTERAVLRAAGVAQRSHLDRLFREHTGHTPKRYLRLARIQLAAKLLRTTPWSVDVCAATAGLAGRSHLNYLLRHYYDMTPGELRRRSTTGTLLLLAPLLDFNPYALADGELNADPETQRLPDVVDPNDVIRQRGKRYGRWRVPNLHAPQRAPTK